MKSFYLSILILALFTACQTKQNQERSLNTQAAKQQVEEKLVEFFDAFDSYDYQQLRDLTTEDYSLIENGPIWSMDTTVSKLKQYEERGIKMVHKLSEIQTTVDGSTAWVIYKNVGVFTGGKAKRNMEWIESAVFTKRENEWKMAMLHSTVLKRNASKQEE